MLSGGTDVVQGQDDRFRVDEWGGVGPDGWMDANTKTTTQEIKSVKMQIFPCPFSCLTTLYNLFLRLHVSIKYVFIDWRPISEKIGPTFTQRGMDGRRHQRDEGFQVKAAGSGLGFEEPVALLQVYYV